MSRRHREALPVRQKLLALAAIVLMVPVLLDAVHVVTLGKFRLVPFFLLAIAAVFVISWHKAEKENG